ncbi:hypothetical protein [Parvicella tangerina]|uniref:Uncharacterized protein n=1 Tax=Parvicella tangerina TaxID=2829795 RepID=A0A916JKU4_9FLAO|nr:hypothetical protein [Parvicella tangerina]CAG5078955.1 hypothetical protein CRYO30217_00817 [Parvicella tangerina]
MKTIRRIYDFRYTLQKLLFVVFVSQSIKAQKVDLFISLKEYNDKKILEVNFINKSDSIVLVNYFNYMPFFAFNNEEMSFDIYADCGIYDLKLKQINIGVPDTKLYKYSLASEDTLSVIFDIRGLLQDNSSYNMSKCSLFVYYSNRCFRTVSNKLKW